MTRKVELPGNTWTGFVRFAVRDKDLRLGAKLTALACGRLEIEADIC